MIREIIKTPKNRYGRFFLSTEAPEDETENDPDAGIIKSNTKVITVKPSNRNRIDFTAGAEDDITDDTIDTTVDDATAQDDDMVDTGDVDFTSGAEDGTTEPPIADASEQPTADTIGDDQTNPDTTVGDNPDMNPDTVPAGEDTTPTVDDPENPDAGEETPDDDGLEDDVDFTSDAADDGTDDTNANVATGDEANGQTKGPGLEYDSTRKYKLFQNYISLINALDNYMAKLESKLIDVYEINKIYRNAIDKLQEVRDLAFNYITMKFEISSYVQSLLFYENLIVMVQLIFEYIEKGQNEIKKNVDKKSKTKRTK